MSNVIVRSGEMRERAFDIDRTPDAFEALSDGLYSDVITAVIRELGCNALDAHTDADNLDTQVELHLPNYNKPLFYIRDYGIGMTPEQLEQNYIVYFYSSKRKDTKTTGKFGLGCKSPFAYTRTFNVTSYYNGLKYPYVAYVSEGTPDELDDDGNIIKEGQVGGYPRLTYLGEEEEVDGVMVPVGIPTDEHNGLKVEFAVKSGDCYSFQEKAKKVYSYFREDRRPNIVNSYSNDFEIPTFTYSNEGVGWGLMDYGTGTAKAIMGNIAYPIRIDSYLTETQSTILNSNIHIKFKVDSLDIVPSREHLKYNPRTVSRLLRRIDSISKELNDDISKQFENCKTLWEAKVLYQSIVSSKSKISQMAGVKNLKWNGKPIDGASFNFSHIKGVSCLKIYRDKRNYYSEDYVTRKEHTWNIFPSSDCIIVEKDCNRGPQAKIIRGLINGDYKSYYLVDFNDGDFPECKKEFKECLGGYEIGKTSELPEYLEQRTRTTRKYVKAFIHSGSSWHESDEDIDEDEGGIYAPMYAQGRGMDFACVDVNKSGYKLDSYELNSLLDAVREYTDDEEFNVYGIRRPIKKSMEENENWVNFVDYIEDLSDKILEDNKLIQEYLEYKKFSSYKNNECFYYHIDTISKRYINTFGKGDNAFIDKVYELLEKVDSYKVADYTKMNAVETILEKVGKEVTAKYNGSVEFISLDTAFFKEFPLLKYCFTKCWNSYRINTGVESDSKFYNDIVLYIHKMK